MPPTDDFRIERFADAEHMAQAETDRIDLTTSSPAPISMRNAVGALYHTVTPYFCNRIVPILRAETSAADDVRRAVQPRRENAVRGAR